MNFCVAILILRLEENMQHFWHIMLYYFKKGKNATEMQKKFVQCMEKVLWLIESVKSGLWSAGDFSLDDAHGWVVQLKVIVIKLRHWEQCYHAGDSQHTQNIQMNKVTGENENVSFIFQKKTKWNFWPTLYKAFWGSFSDLGVIYNKGAIIGYWSSGPCS